MSTVEVSENALPVSLVSSEARRSLRVRRREAARSRMRERSGAGVLDQAGKARAAEAMAASMSEGVEVRIVASGREVEGSMVWNVRVEEEGCGLPS